MALWIIIVIALIIAIPFGFRIWSGVNDEIQSSDNFNADTKAVAQNMTEKMPGYWDGGFLILVFMIYIAILISVWFVDIHPVYVALSLLSVILLIVVGGIANNITEQILKILHTLTPKEEQIIKMRFGIGFDRDLTLEEVGDHFSITRERVRQIEVKAMRKLKHPKRLKLLKTLNIED